MTIVDGIQIFPTSTKIDHIIDLLVSQGLGNIIPMALGMAFPVFLHTLVMEKETRLLDTMKINGMRMSNYWLVSFVFYQLYYLCIAFVLYYLGAYYF